MALDEALLESFSAGSSPPTLRLYGWRPATLSLGRYQDAAADLDIAKCSADGVSVVRRMTGGGIIYHDDELTYSIVCSPADLGHVSGVKDGFRHLCAFLLATYHKLGLHAAFATEVDHGGIVLGARSAFCFAGREHYDIVVHGKKIGGNAQRRKRNVIFQHGSIPLSSCVEKALRYLRAPAHGLEHTVSLAELGIAVPLEQLKELLAAAFEEELQVRLHPGAVSVREAEAAERLLAAKYQAERWNVAGKETHPHPDPPLEREGT